MPRYLLPLQECDDVGQVVANVPRMSGRFDTYAPRHAVAMAWDRTRFELLDEGWVEIGSDQYGQRITAWIRLRDRQNAGEVEYNV